MKKTLLALLLLTNPAPAAEWSPEYAQNLRQEAARRHAEIARHNRAQAEAHRLVAQGLGVLTRPAYARGGYSPGYSPYAPGNVRLANPYQARALGYSSGFGYGGGGYFSPPALGYTPGNVLLVNPYQRRALGY